MSALSLYELELARAAAAETMTETCAVQVAASSNDESGYPTTTYTEIQNVRCRVGKWAVANDDYLAERIHAKGGLVFTLNRHITTKDRIVYGPHTYEIVQGDDPAATNLVVWVYYGIRL